MRYPISKAEAIPGSGGAIYLFLMENVSTPGSLPHRMWYNGLAKQMEDPTSTPFRGFFPVGQTYRLSYAGSPMGDYTFTGNEQNAVFVKDLSKEAMLQLGITANMDSGSKVFNPFFKPWEELDEDTIKLNELPALSLAKSISGWCSQVRSYYTEVEVRDFLISACRNPSSGQMMYILHGNHVAWCTHRFMKSASGMDLEADIKKEFYSQNSPDFYIKDIGTIMPSILYVLGLLGEDVIEFVDELPFDLWGIDDVAKEIYDMMAQKLAA